MEWYNTGYSRKYIQGYHMTMIPLRRVVQLPAYCGPATLAMMLSQYNIIASQRAVAQRGNAEQLIDDNGMRIDQLALATRNIAPHLRMWAKRDATFEDIDVLINQFNLPVGVEWQEIGANEQWEDDNGHYSVIIGIDMEKHMLTIRNPDSCEDEDDETYTFETFDKAWFDTNVVGPDAPEEAQEWMDDYHVLFVVAPKDLAFPEQLNLKRVRVPSRF